MVHGLDMKEIVIISESVAQQTAWENSAKLSSSDEFKSNFYKSICLHLLFLPGMFQ